MTFDIAARLPRPSRAFSTKRPELPDALRGFALLLTPAFSLFGTSALEMAVSLAVLLSLLCGMSLAARADRTGRGPMFLRLLARRMLMESVAHRYLWTRLFRTMLVATAVMAVTLQQVMPLAGTLFICCLAAFVLLFQRSRWRQMLIKLAPMGRLTLVNSLVQVLVFTLLLHALGPRFGVLPGVALPFAALPVLQAMVSCRWLARGARNPAGPRWQPQGAEVPAG